MSKSTPRPIAATNLKHTSLKQGAILNWLSLGLNFSVSFVVTPIIIHKLGSSGFGMWALIQSFSGYYGLVNLGLASALQRYISRDLALRDVSSLQATVGTAISFFSYTGVFVLVAAYTLAGPATHFFDIPSTETRIFRTTLLLCATAVVADFFGALLGTMFTARERFDISNGIGIARQLIQAVGILLVLQFAASINAIALVVASVSLLGLGIGWMLIQKLYPQVTLSWQGSSLLRLKELLHYGTSTVLITVSNIIRLRLGNLVIAKTVDIATVGIFSLASNLIVSMNSVMSASLNVLNPRFTRLHTQNNQRELQRLFRIALFVSSTLACGIGLLLLIFGERFILFWVGPNFLPSVPILNVLTIAYVVSHAQAPGWNLMFAMAKHHFMAKVTIIEASVIVGLGLWLSHTHGALGFAWATAASMLTTKLFFQPGYTARLAGMELKQYLAPMVIPFIAAIVIFVVSKWLGISGLLRAGGPILFLSLAAGVGIVYCGLVIISARQRDFIPLFIAKFLRK